MTSAMVIGSGAREHAIAWKLAQSSLLDTVYCAEGNPGTALEPKTENVFFSDYNEVLEFAEREGVDLVVVGPEKPLAEGIADSFRKHGLKVFGFGKNQAMLESSKVFAKRFCEKYGVLTPAAKVFSNESDAISFLEENRDRKFFVKADELCGGKGAFPASNPADGMNAVSELLVKKKCGTGEKVLIEEWIEGRELTVMAFTDGKTVSLMPASQDHKRLLDGDNGPNTGGMGAYAPAPLFDSVVKENFKKSILEPTLRGLREEGFNDAGILYFGIMVDRERKTHLLEYNVRFGDPEAQAVLQLLDSDFFALLNACAVKKLREEEKNIEWKNESAVSITLAARGYPVNYGSEREQISGIEKAESIPGVKVFHAGTAVENGMLVTAGGRILSVAAHADSLPEARLRAYSAIGSIHFNGMRFRSDIALRTGGN